MKTELKNNSDGFSTVIIILALLVVVIAGVTAYMVSGRYGRAKQSLRPALVTISRSNPLHQPGAVPFSVAVTDTHMRDTLLHDVMRLAPVKAGAVSCPNDDGVSYELYFTVQKLMVNADAAGCQFVSLSNSSMTYRATPAFWKDVSQATGYSIGPDSRI